jgi:hypothetical protein
MEVHALALRSMMAKATTVKLASICQRMDSAGPMWYVGTESGWLAFLSATETPTLDDVGISFSGNVRFRRLGLAPPALHWWGCDPSVPATFWGLGSSSVGHLAIQPVPVFRPPRALAMVSAVMAITPGSGFVSLPMVSGGTSEITLDVVV